MLVPAAYLPLQIEIMDTDTPDNQCRAALLSETSLCRFKDAPLTTTASGGLLLCQARLSDIYSKEWLMIVPQ